MISWPSPICRLCVLCALNPKAANMKNSRISMQLCYVDLSTYSSPVQKNNFQGCIFCCGQRPVGARVLLHTIPANKRARGFNGPAEGGRVADTPPTCPLYWQRIFNIFAGESAAALKSTTNQWSLMYGCSQPQSLPLAFMVLADFYI